MSTGQGRDSRRIVVVVDWSEPSKAALRWAIRQAKLTGAEVEAVTTWWYPPGSRLAPTSDGLVDLEGDAGKTLVGRSPRSAASSRTWWSARALSRATRPR